MKNYLKIALLTVVLASCQSNENELASLKMNSKNDSLKDSNGVDNFKYIAEQFADLRVLRYNVKDFDKLDLKIKTLLYYLSEAALCGRDINFDQNHKYNLVIRKTLEAILSSDTQDKETEDFKKLENWPLN